MNRINRRVLLGAMSAAVLAGSAGLAMAAGEIRVLNWQGYGTDEAFATEAFEKKTGVKVVHDYFTSEQEMLTKLRTNPGAYDVVVTSRKNVRLFLEQLRFDFVPVLHGLQWRLAAEG